MAKRVRKAPEARRADVLGAARELALEAGLAAVTQRAVAERAGVTPALVTHYAGRMELLVAGVFRAIAREELDEVAARIAAADGATADVARLAALLDALIRDYRREVALVWVDAWSLSRRNDDLAAALREEALAWEALAASVLERGCASGAFRVDDPAALARFLIGATDGLSAQSAVWAGYEAETVQHVHRAAAAILGIPTDALAAPVGPRY